MNIYRKRETTLFFLLFASIFSATATVDAINYSSDQFDTMVDFAYPVSAMQAVRQDCNQALYFAQHHDFEKVATLLEQGQAKLAERQVRTINEEDRDYIQQIINQIDALISTLEQQERSGVIKDLCQQIQENL